MKTPSSILSKRLCAPALLTALLASAALSTSSGCGDDVQGDPSATAGASNSSGAIPTQPGLPGTPGQLTTTTTGGAQKPGGGVGTSTGGVGGTTGTLDTNQDTSGTDGTPKDCIGVDPTAGGELFSLLQDQPEGAQDCETPPACVGMDAPFWELHDYQPESCGYNQDYGMGAFNKHVTMVVFLTGW